jgi:hypothetical protein
VICWFELETGKAALVAPAFPGGKELGSGNERNGCVRFGAFIEPLLDQVLVVEIVRGGVGDDLGGREADALPLTATNGSGTRS